MQTGNQDFVTLWFFYPFHQWPDNNPLKNPGHDINLLHVHAAFMHDFNAHSRLTIGIEKSSLRLRKPSPHAHSLMHESQEPADKIVRQSKSYFDHLLLQLLLQQFNIGWSGHVVQNDFNGGMQNKNTVEQAGFVILTGTMQDRWKTENHTFWTLYRELQLKLEQDQHSEWGWMLALNQILWRDVRLKKCCYPPLQ